MKTNILTLITIAIAILFTSCEKEIEFKGEQTDPKLVINSLMEPEQPVKAAISKSFFFLDNHANTTAPDDLVAMLYVNGNLIGEMIPHNDTVVSYDIWNPDDSDLGHIRKVYTYDYCPAEGDVVKITASANGFDDVEAETSPLPNALLWAVTNSKIKDWTSGYSPWYNEFENEEDSVFYIYCTIELTIEVTDPNPGQTDFFRIHANRGSQYDYYDAMNYMSYYAEYNDPIFSSVIVANNEYVDFSDLDLSPEGVFTDVLFDGKSYQIKMPFNISIRKNEEVNLDFFRIVLTLEHLSKEYYNYLNTCDQGDVSMQLYAEPIQTYSNVKGGYGIVAGHVIDTLWFALPLSE